MPRGPDVRLIRFGVFELDLETRELRRRGRFVALPPQPFAVLALLAERPGEVVTRDELRKALWAEGVHGDHERGLNHCVNRVRRTLLDSAHAPRFIETVPRVGYRFLATVETVAAAPRTVEASRRPGGPRGKALLTLAATLVLALQSAGVPRRSTPRGPGLPSLDPVAEAAFQKGRRLLDQGPAGWRRSVDFFREAARQDGAFALARYGLADAYLRLGENGLLGPDQAFPAAREAALAALQIEDRAEPLVILAALKLNYEWDWKGAERLYLRAIRLDPGFLGPRLGYARLLSAAGRHADALRTIREAEARRPACVEVVRDAGFIHYRAHRFEEAARRFHDWADLQPESREPHHWLALVHHLEGRLPDAKREARLVLTLAGTHSRALEEFDALPPGPAMERYLQGCLGHLRRLSASQWVTADDFARIRAQLGEREAALDDLRRAADERSPRLLPFLADPAFDLLRPDPRFRALLHRVGAPDPQPEGVTAFAVAALLP